MNVTTAQTVANTNEINPETISLAAAVLGMLLIALVGVGGFTVLAQRRLRSIGMLAAQGATAAAHPPRRQGQRRRHRRRGRRRGRVLGFLAWLAYRPQAENSAHHVIGVFQLPWTVIGISMVLAIIATYFAASRPAKAIARVPVVAALAGRPPAPRKTRHLAIPIGLGFLVVAFLLLGAAGATTGSGGRHRATRCWNSPSASSRSPSPSCCWPRRSWRWSPRLGKRSPDRGTARAAGPGPVPGTVRPGARGDQPEHADRGHHLRGERRPVRQRARLRRPEPHVQPAHRVRARRRRRLRPAAPTASATKAQIAAAPKVAKDIAAELGTTSMITLEHDQREPEARRVRALLVRPDLRGDAAAAQRVRHQAVPDQPRRRHPHDAAGPVHDEPDAAHLRQPSSGKRRRPGLNGRAGTGPTAPTSGPARREAASPTRPSRRSASSRPAPPRRTR